MSTEEGYDFAKDATAANIVLEDAYTRRVAFSTGRRTGIRASLRPFLRPLAWSIPQLTLFLIFAAYYGISDRYVTMRAIMGFGLPVARAAAMMLNINCCLLLLPVCTKLISRLQRRFTRLARVGMLLQTMALSHIYLAFTVITFTVIHVLAHSSNFVQVASDNADHSAVYMWFLSGPGLTGQVALLALFLITATSATKRIRRNNFNVFYYTHHLYFVFYAALLIHGSFCMIKIDTDAGPAQQCAGPSFWKFAVFPVLLYICDRAVREAGATAVVKNLVWHPTDVLEIQFDIEQWRKRDGRYSLGLGSNVRLCCPKVSRLEWHPFTLTSGSNCATLSVHVKVCGDWTQKLASEFKARSQVENKPVIFVSYQDYLPSLMVDGPYTGMLNSVGKEPVAVFIGGGIGATPIASVLKSLLTDNQTVKTDGLCARLEKIVVVWVCSDVDSFKWLQEQLAVLESIDTGTLEINIMLYWTAKRATLNAIHLVYMNVDSNRDVLTGLKTATSFGRPNWRRLLAQVLRNSGDNQVGVYICGPELMCVNIQAACDQLNNLLSHKRLFCHQESF